MEVAALVVLGLILLTALAVAFRFRSRRAFARHDNPYALLPGLLSQTEAEFCHALLAAVDGRYLVAPKVRVADVLKVARAGSLSTGTVAFNKIAMKHFDFVLCDPQTFAFVGAIELDDQSHRRNDRVARDAFINEATAAAGLPLHRFRAKAKYVVEDIRDSLMPRAMGPQTTRRLADGRIEPTL